MNNSDSRVVTPQEAQTWVPYPLRITPREAQRLAHTVATEESRRDMAYDAGVDDGYAQALTDHADRTRAAVVKALRETAEALYPVPAYLRVAERADDIENGADY